MILQYCNNGNVLFIPNYISLSDADTIFPHTHNIMFSLPSVIRQIQNVALILDLLRVLSYLNIVFVICKSSAV